MGDQEKWAINESLLQSYRSIFISSQAFLLAVGAIVSGKSTLVLVVAAAISLLMIWAIGLPVVRSRHLIVDYYKHGASLSESARSELCSERDYVHNRELRRKANVAVGIDTNWRPTRLKIDLMIPILFSCVWAALILHELYWA